MSRAILDCGNGKGWDATWTGGAWELVDFLKNQIGSEWVNCTILRSDLSGKEAGIYELIRLDAIKARQQAPQPPVVEQLPAEREWRPARKAWEPSPPINGLEASIRHNYITSVGDGLDWLDHDTRLLVQQAIEHEDTDDLEEFAAIAGACPLTKFPYGPKQYARLGQKHRKRYEAA